MAARAGLLPPCVVPALSLCFHIPELLSDTLFFRRRLLRLLSSVDLPLLCSQITVILLHKDRGLVIQPLEGLYIGISVLFYPCKHGTLRLGGLPGKHDEPGNDTAGICRDDP